MNQYQEAADNIRRIAKAFEGFKLAADALDSIGSVAQASKEAERAAAKARAEVEEAKAELGTAKEDAKKAKAKAAELVEDAKAKAVALVEDAEAKARGILDDAAANAGAKAQAMLDNAQVSVSKLMATAAKLSQNITEQEKNIEALDAEIATKQMQLNKLNAAIEALREKLA